MSATHPGADRRYATYDWKHKLAWGSELAKLVLLELPFMSRIHEDHPHDVV